MLRIIVAAILLAIVGSGGTGEMGKRFRQGEELDASDINRIVDSLIPRITGGKGVTVRSFGNRLIVSKAPAVTGGVVAQPGTSEWEIVAFARNTWDGFSTRLRMEFYVDGSPIYSTNKNNQPSWSDNGTLQVTVDSNKLITVTYSGITITYDASAQPDPAWTWYPTISLFDDRALAGSGQLEAYDNFVMNSISDNFNRAPGTLFSDPNTKWVGSGNDILSNRLVPVIGVGGGSMYWDATLNQATFDSQIELVSLTTSGSHTWSIEKRIKNF